MRGNAYEHVLEIVNMIINKALGEIKEKDLIAVKRSYIQGLRQLEDDTWSWNQRIGMGYLNGSVDGIDRKKQMQGYDVTQLKNILIDKGYLSGKLLKGTSLFDEETEKAVIKFQKSIGIDADGIVETQTVYFLKK